MKLLDMALIGLLTLGAVVPALGLASTSGSRADCEAGACAAEGEGEVLFRVRTRGEEFPVVEGSDPAALQSNRRVDILRQDLPGQATVTGTFQVDLPGGGMLWATEDPALTPPMLSVQAGTTVPFDGGRILKPLRLHGYTNYAAFIERLEVTIHRGDDADQVRPLATVSLPVANVIQAEWDGSLPAGTNLQVGDDLLYVTRAYGKEGQFDETVVQRIQLVTPEAHERGLSLLRNEVQRSFGQVLDGEAAQSLQIGDAIYGHSQLRLRNIPVYGSRVRIYGRDIPQDTQLSINGQHFPIDQERRFVAEFLEPVGLHSYEVAVKSPAGEARHSLDVEVTGRYSFMVALADVTVSRSRASGNIEPLAAGDRFDDSFITDGRLAFYLKGKIQGRYLITAHADTREREISELFSGFFDAYPQDIFRRLDPDLYYPVYGDDSTTWRDVDTQGRLYVRMDWDHNEAMWGNFHTGITGTEYGQYSRSLYGAALRWRSSGANTLGDPDSQLRVFASKAYTAPGHSQFLGTGGSLYYLRHTDVLPGSDKVVLEVRDASTGRVEARVDLLRGADYEIDELQGRIILTRPLSQVTRENVRSLIRDAPLDGYEQLLLVDYEYVPVGFRAEDVSVGLRGKQWLGDHVAIGGTYVDESRGGEDYTLRGVDVTLQAGRGTYLRLEHTRSEATAAPIFYSDNGGLSFVQRNPDIEARRGDARAVEARANFRELGWSTRDWAVGAWWRDVDPGFSISRFDAGTPVTEYGAEFLGWFTKDFSLYGRHSSAERGDNLLRQTQLTADWRLSEPARLGAEVRQLEERRGTTAVDATLAALSYRHRVNPLLELYGVGQYTVDDDSGRYPKNDRIALGARYLYGDRSSLGAEVSDGSRGHAARLEAEHRISPDHSVYGGWTYSTDSTERDPLFNSALQNGWTLGQRWRLNNQTHMYNESQSLKDRHRESAGLAHTFGMDFYPARGWNLGFTVMDGELEHADGTTQRRAYSVAGGRTDPRTQWSSKLEYRRDSGLEQREQWVTTNRLLYRVNEDWRLALRANYADTRDRINPLGSAELAEVNVGFAWRPHDSTRWAAFGRYTYLYDVASLGQEGGAFYDQRSQVLSLEAIRRLDARWALAGKLASRWGDYRMDRGSGDWLDSRADFAAVQARYHLVRQWDALAEYRWLRVRDGGHRRGWLLGVDRKLGDNFKIGLGYNFTDFSDSLTDLRYDHRGWLLNLAGYY